MTGPGHNSGAAFEAQADTLTAETQGRLKGFIERIEQVEAEQAEAAEAKREIYAELGGEGFDKKVVRKIIRLRKQDRAERAEEEALLELYLGAIGML